MNYKLFILRFGKNIIKFIKFFIGEGLSADNTNIITDFPDNYLIID